MRVREYLNGFNKNTRVTFIKARARKDANTPFYHTEYQTTPALTIEQWDNMRVMDYYILNDKQQPIQWLSGAGWVNEFKRGDLLSLLVISEEELHLLYNKKQASDIIEYIDSKLKQ